MRKITNYFKGNNSYHILHAGEQVMSEALKKRIVLFLGAGASAAFDYPTTKQFVDRLKVEIAESDKSSTRAEDKLLIDILTIPHVKDVEHVLEILQSLQVFEKHPLKEFIEKFKISIAMPSISNNLEDLLTVAKILDEKIKSYVYQQYQFSPETIYRITSVYKPLFDKIMVHRGDNEIPVFTTNYDRVVEKFCQKNNCICIDGFRDIKTEEFEWYPDEFQRTEKGATIKLFKLHGSLNWRRRNDGLPVKIGAEERVRDSKQFKENILIYPAEKSKPEVEPFKTLHEKFEEYYKDCEVCVFIGFSFRDEYLNSIISRDLEKKKIIIVSPNASDHRKQLVKKLKARSHRILGINEFLEKPNTLSKIDEFLSKDVVTIETEGKGPIKIKL
jgi:hypothetical protein